MGAGRHAYGCELETVAEQIHQHPSNSALLALDPPRLWAQSVTSRIALVHVRASSGEPMSTTVSTRASGAEPAPSSFGGE